MSDHRERFCTNCGSLLHHEDDCVAHLTRAGTDKILKRLDLTLTEPDLEHERLAQARLTGTAGYWDAIAMAFDVPKGHFKNMLEVVEAIEKLRADNQAHCSALMTTAMWMGMEEDLKNTRDKLASLGTELVQLRKIADEFNNGAEWLLGIDGFKEQHLVTALLLEKTSEAHSKLPHVIAAKEKEGK